MPDPYKDLHLTNDTYEPPMYAPIPSHFSESEPRFPLYRSAPPSHRRFFRLQGSLRQEFPEQPTGAQCEILYEAFPLQVRSCLLCKNPVLIISGRIIIDNVNAPAKIENPQSSVFTKNNIPNNPYTIDGIPESVSVVRRITSTNLFPFPEYSTRKIAEKIPNGTAIKRESIVITIVLISAGTTEAFSEV